jgi:uncharacterized membrane protein/protein-disulfide isomerase
MTSKTRALALGFALLGLGASAASSYVHYQLASDPTYTSFCDVNATVSCTQAYLSKYGSLFGVPVAMLGVAFFASVLMMIALAPQPRVIAGGKRTRAAESQIVGGENVAGYVFVLSAVGLAFSMYLAWASFFQLRALCVLCALTYVAVLGLFIVSARAQSVPAGELPARAVRDGIALLKKPLTLAMIVVLVAAASFALISFPRETAPSTAASNGDAPIPRLTDGQRAQFQAWYKVQPVLDVPIDRGSAKVLIVKFNDYQCPPCRQTHEQYKGILAKHTASGDVKYVIKHFPLEMECNTKNAGHLAACEAAAAVLMAEEKGTAPKLEEWLFANQGPPQLTPDQVRRAAEVVGGVSDFDARYKDLLTRLSADAALGVKLGVESTPTFFINGRRIPGGLPPAAFEEAIQYELKRP